MSRTMMTRSRQGDPTSQPLSPHSEQPMLRRTTRANSQNSDNILTQTPGRLRDAPSGRPGEHKKDAPPVVASNLEAMNPMDVLQCL